MISQDLNRRYSTVYGEISYGITGEGPPLVLVHGTPWSSFNWRHIISGLSPWLTVYYYDLLGYGTSEMGEIDVSLGIQNKVLYELLEFWGLKKPLIVGHDFGGTTVLRTHLLQKQEFEKIIIIDPVALSPWGSPFFKHIQEFEEVFQKMPSYIHDAMLSAYVKSAMCTEMNQETLYGIKKPWLSEAGQAAFYRQIGQANQRYTDEIENLYHTIDTPLLIVWGEEDEWIPIEKGYELYEKIQGSIFAAVPNAGHLVQEDQPSIFSSIILKFFLK